MDKGKKMFKLLSVLCLIGFYFIILLGIFACTMHISFLVDAESALAKSFGNFEPIFSILDIKFYQNPELFAEKSFQLLSLTSTLTMIFFALFFLWFMHKLLKNVYEESLFMYENVALIFKLGLTYIILGTAFTYFDGLLLSKTITALQITNAEMKLSDLSYIDFILWGIVLIVIATALKTAVLAVEENKKTI